MYALDTNTVSYFLKGMGRVAERLLDVPPREVALPSVVVLELEYGSARSAAPQALRQRLQTLLQTTTVLTFGREEARVAARIRCDLERRGQPIGPYDLIIAATALVARATLVTHNLREFRRVKELTVEDWY